MNGSFWGFNNPRVFEPAPLPHTVDFKHPRNMIFPDAGEPLGRITSHGDYDDET